MSTKGSNKQKDFALWLENNGILLDCSEIEKKTIKALNNNGIKISSLYKESDPIKIRLYISELVMKRDLYKDTDYLEFVRILLLLLSYAEFLGCGDMPKKQVCETKKTINGKERDRSADALIVAYCLSRTNRMALKELKFNTFKEAFEKTSAILGQKPSTIKNMRDEFDPYFDNGRVGWYQRQLSPSRRRVFDKYSKYTDDEIIALTKELLASYDANQIVSSKKQEKKKDKHKLIRITGNNLKEIKSRKQ